MFNDRYHLTDGVLAKYKRQTRRIESRQRYQVGEVVAVAMSYWDNYFGTPEGERLFSHSGKAGMYNKMFVKADEMRHKIRITKAWRENLQDISNEDCLVEGICYDEDRQEFFFFEDHEGEFVMETRNARWKVRCDCGEIFEVTATNVKSGHTKSCGCLRIENNKKRHQL